MNVPSVALVDGHASQYATELAQCRTHEDAAVVEAELANRPLMPAPALLHDRERLTHLAAVLEVAQQHDGISEISGIDRGGHVRPEQTRVCADENRRHVP